MEKHLVTLRRFNGPSSFSSGRLPLARYPFYFAALGKFELQGGEYESARKHFLAALALARNPMERRFLEQRVIACSSASAQQVS